MNIVIRTNIDEFLISLENALKPTTNPDQLMREVATSLLGVTKNRIHEEGKAANGEQIGEYSDGYLKLRQRKYNRSSSKKTILSLTTQMENDYKVIATDKGYGIGYDNPFNRQKADWNEQTYKKKIFALTEEEKEQARQIAIDFIQR